MKLILQQNKHLSVAGGLESLKMCKFPGTRESFNIPLVGNKIDTSVLTKEELQDVEKQTGYKFSTDAGRDYYTSLAFSLPASQIILNTERAEDLLLYKYGMKLGYIAETESVAAHPMSKHRFFVYNAELEEALNLERNLLKGNIYAKLSEMRAANNTDIIYFCKDLHDNSEKYTITSAFNKLVNFAEVSLENVKKLDVCLTQDLERLRLRVDVKDGISANILKREVSGYYVNAISGTKLGRNVLEIMEFYTDPKNADELMAGGKAKDSSLRNQLKNINK